MSRIVDSVNRVLGRSVVDLAGEVDAALGRLASAQHQEAQCRESLSQASALVAQARADVTEARDALFREHPDLAPDSWNSTTVDQGQLVHPRPDSLLPGQDPSKFEIVEVDDSDDPRFTAGVSSVDPSDDGDLPPVTWEEHDG